MDSFHGNSQVVRITWSYGDSVEGSEKFWKQLLFNVLDANCSMSGGQQDRDLMAGSLQNETAALGLQNEDVNVPMTGR